MAAPLHLCGPVIHPRTLCSGQLSLSKDASPSEVSWLTVSFHSWVMMYSDLSFAGVFRITLLFVCLFAVTKGTE